MSDRLTPRRDRVPGRAPTRDPDAEAVYALIGADDGRPCDPMRIPPVLVRTAVQVRRTVHYERDDRDRLHQRETFTLDSLTRAEADTLRVALQCVPPYWATPFIDHLTAELTRRLQEG